MRRFRGVLVGLFTLGLVSALVVPALSGHARVTRPDEGGEGPYPEGLYLQMREEQIAKYRGLPWHTTYNARGRAYNRYRAQRSEVRRSAASSPFTSAVDPAWTELGPAPIPVGSPNNGPDTGRVTAIVVDPTNPDIVYVGAAQGGVWRTMDGGAAWTPLMDDAQSLAVGALALDPNHPNTLWVGTGEPSFSADSFFGVGLYRIQNANSDPPTRTIDDIPFDTRAAGLGTGPGNGHAFSGTSISKIVIDPSNSDRMWVGTSYGFSGISGDVSPAAADPGLYFSSNATDSTPTFSQDGAIGTKQVTDVALEPGSPSDTLLVGLISSDDSSGDGIYRATNASSVSVSGGPDFNFARKKNLSGTNTNIPGVVHFTFSEGSPSTVYAVYNKGGGKLIKSTNGGATWGSPISGATGFCDDQCYYDMPVAVDPTAVNHILVGGNYHYGSASGWAIKRSTNGSTFAGREGGLHPDTHAIAFSSDGKMVWTGNDGGVWKSANDGYTWTNENNATLGITQFQSISTHPTDPNLFLGGTQDNGTEEYFGTNEWAQSDGGDGGFALIDQSSTSTTADTMYHTFFNGTGAQIGFARSTDGGQTWPKFLGCGGTANGISCSDGTLFYAPMALGPGSPNTLYFGTTKLYRSTNRGTTMTRVSKTFGNATDGPDISAIGIAPANDNVRLVGLTDGEVWGTTTGSSMLTNMSGGLPSAYVARAVIDPNDSSTAYVTFDSYFGDSTPHIWKTTDLGSTHTWSGAANGIPDVPVNAFVIDPNDPMHLFAGTDVGVYESTDAGANWAPYGAGLPNAAVFDLAISQPGTGTEMLRAATHGRGVWEVPISSSVPPSHALIVTKNGTGTGTIASSSPDASINCGPTCSNTYADGTKVTLNAAPAAGSEFVGWSGGGCSGTGQCVTTVNGTTTVTATFNLKGPAHRPDMWIRDLNGNQHGKNVYCSSPCKKQIVYGYGTRGATGAFDVTIQNDAVLPDTFKLTGPGNSTSLKIQYFSGPSCCSTPLHAVTSIVQPGKKGAVVTVVITIKKTATLGSHPVKIIGQSIGTTVKDVVEIKVVAVKSSPAAGAGAQPLRATWG